VKLKQKHVQREMDVCVSRWGNGISLPGQQAGEADRLESCQSKMLGSQVLSRPRPSTCPLFIFLRLHYLLLVPEALCFYVVHVCVCLSLLDVVFAMTNDYGTHWLIFTKLLSLVHLWKKGELLRFCGQKVKVTGPRLALYFPTRISVLRLGSSRESVRRWDARILR